MKKSHSKIRNKLLVLMLLISIIPISLITFVAVGKSMDSMENEIVEFNRLQLITVSEYMSEKIDQLEVLIDSMIIDRSLRSSIVNLENEDISQYYRSKKYIMDNLSSIYYANQNFLDAVMVYVSENKRIYYVSREQEFIREAESTQTVQWSYIENETRKLNFLNHPADNSFYLMRGIHRFEDRQLIGEIILNVNWSIMDRVLSVLHQDHGSEVYLLDQDRNVLYSPNIDFERESIVNLTDLPVMEDPSFYLKQENVYIFSQQVPNVNLSIVKVLPDEMITSHVKRTVSYSIVIGLLIIVLCVILSFMFSYMLTKPITNLVAYMRKLDWIKSDYVADRNRTDEIGLLETSFETMMKNIKGLIEFEYQAAIEKRTAEIKALQAQINPHFLQNTLQLISGIALEKGAPEIHQIVKAIGKMFRYSIKNEHDIVSLSDEWGHIRNYLYIQQMRFTDKIEVDEQLPESLALCRIPKLTLQPILENAFEHGFSSKLNTWKLKLTAKRQEDDLLIQISDNGIGIEEARLTELQTMLADTTSSVFQPGESLGLRNVDARIKMHFGRSYGLTIQSIAGHGSQIIIRLPADQPEMNGGKGNEGDHHR